MNTATHNVEVPFPQAFASRKRSPFPSAPRYGEKQRFSVEERSEQAARRVCAPVMRFYAASSLLWQTRSCFYLRYCIAEPAETRFSCQGARGMIAQNRTNVNKTREPLPAGSASFIPWMNHRGFLMRSL